MGKVSYTYNSKDDFILGGSGVIKFRNATPSLNLLDAYTPKLKKPFSPSTFALNGNENLNRNRSILSKNSEALNNRKNSSSQSANPNMYVKNYNHSVFKIINNPVSIEKHMNNTNDILSNTPNVVVENTSLGSSENNRVVLPVKRNSKVLPIRKRTVGCRPTKEARDSKEVVMLDRLLSRNMSIDERSTNKHILKEPTSIVKKNSESYL